MAIIERRDAFWTAAVLRRFFDGQPKIEFHQTPAANLTGSWKAPFRIFACIGTMNQTWAGSPLPTVAGIDNPD